MEVYMAGAGAPPKLEQLIKQMLEEIEGEKGKEEKVNHDTNQ